jgi:hypothetical protein
LKIDKLILNQIIYKCAAKCFPSTCNQLYYQYITKTFSLANKTKLNLIPAEFPHFRFVETLKLDVNQLVYNLGGIIGLWFGLSPVSIAYFLTILRSNLNNFIAFYKK